MAKRKYADQRAHNTFWSTAKQRNSADKRAKSLDRKIKAAAKKKK